MHMPWNLRILAGIGCRGERVWFAQVEVRPGGETKHRILGYAAQIAILGVRISCVDPFFHRFPSLGVAQTHTWTRFLAPGRTWGLVFGGSGPGSLRDWGGSGVKKVHIVRVVSSAGWSVCLLRECSSLTVIPSPGASPRG